MVDILERILQTKREEIAEGQKSSSLQSLKAACADEPSPRAFLGALEKHHPAVIAEIKKASPSKGVLRDDFDVQAIAKSYEKADAAALSVLTDQQYFQGNDAFIKQVKAVTALPVLRKDFLIDPWQVYQSRVLGADCILLIVAALEDALLSELYGLAKDLGMTVLVEVHNEQECERALKLDIDLLGVNNRNLRTFEVDLNTSIKLSATIPSSVKLVTESGIHTHEDMAKMLRNNIHCFLIGEAFMRTPDPGQALARLCGYVR